MKWTMNNIDQDLKNLLGRTIMDDDINGDNLSICLCDYFTTHLERPDGDDISDSDHSWGEWVEMMEERALDRITLAVQQYYKKGQQ